MPSIPLCDFKYIYRQTTTHNVARKTEMIYIQIYLFGSSEDDAMTDSSLHIIFVLCVRISFSFCKPFSPLPHSSSLFFGLGEHTHLKRLEIKTGKFKLNSFRTTRISSIPSPTSRRHLVEGEDDTTHSQTPLADMCRSVTIRIICLVFTCAIMDFNIVNGRMNIYKQISRWV